jgi:hypothetical protein
MMRVAPLVVRSVLRGCDLRLGRASVADCRACNATGVTGALRLSRMARYACHAFATFRDQRISGATCRRLLPPGAFSEAQRVNGPRHPLSARRCERHDHLAFPTPSGFDSGAGICVLKRGSGVGWLGRLAGGFACNTSTMSLWAHQRPCLADGGGRRPGRASRLVGGCTRARCRAPSRRRAGRAASCRLGRSPRSVGAR